jgi:potassium-transporting ATPase KdpC subunit
MAAFHGRPSATTDTDPNDSTKTVPAPYNASNLGGSNYGPTSKALVGRVKDESGPLAATNPSAKIPVDCLFFGFQTFVFRRREA